MILLVHHRVRDYDAWKPVFDEHQSVREAHGAIRHWLYRSTDDPNDVVVSTEFRSAADARSFVEDPSLKEAMDRAGVEGPPTLLSLEEVEAIDYAGALR
jgi:heme-degrading monooxygenase HmoA